MGRSPLGFRATFEGSGLLAPHAQLSLLRIDSGGRPVSVGDLRAEVEPEPDAVRLSMSLPTLVQDDTEQKGMQGERTIAISLCHADAVCSRSSRLFHCAVTSI